MYDEISMQIEQDEVDELMVSFTELAHDCEHYLENITCGDGELDELNGLFRAIHSIKGNAAMVGAKVLVGYTHSLEEVVDAIRGGQLVPTPIVCESLLLGLDRLKDLHEREFFGQMHENLHERELEHLFTELAEAEGEEITHTCQDVVELLGAGFIYQETLPKQKPKDEGKVEEFLSCITRPEGKSKLEFDLDFFEELALQVDRQSQFWVGRSEKLLSWALKMNDLGDQRINRTQLSAAVYMHDIGMSYISGQTLDKSGRLSEREREEIKRHSMWGYEYLIRVQGWDEAATIVLEHHERIDGLGYPLGIDGHLIHQGAKILAVIDAYFSITNGRADRANRRSIVRAICEINARKGSQFDEHWVNIFNDVIKEELKETESSNASNQ